MDRTENIVELKKLKETIDQKNLQIEEIENKLKLLQEDREMLQKDREMLQEEYERKNVSELPILIFAIDEYKLMPGDKVEEIREYIYYNPDLDIVSFSPGTQLPNAIDCTEIFKEFAMPEKIWSGRVYHSSEYMKIAHNAVTYLKGRIDSLFDSNEINSWAELGSLLTDQVKKKAKLMSSPPNIEESK